MADHNAREMNDRVRNLNEIIRQIQQRSVLPVKLLDVASMMGHSHRDDASSDGIHFDRPRGTEWLNGVFQRHINLLESDKFIFSPPQYLPFSLLGLCMIAWEEGPTREKAQRAAGVGY